MRSFILTAAIAAALVPPHSLPVMPRHPGRLALPPAGLAFMPPDRKMLLPRERPARISTEEDQTKEDQEQWSRDPNRATPCRQ